MAGFSRVTNSPVIAILTVTGKSGNPTSVPSVHWRQCLTLGKYLTMFLWINKVVFFCTMKFILQDHSSLGPYWFCLSWLWGRGLCSVSDKFPLVFSYDRYSFEYGVWKYSSIKPRICNLIYVCILSLNTNSCAHIHLSHVWPSTAVLDFMYTNKYSPFYGKSWLAQQEFQNPMHFSNLICTNKKGKIQTSQFGIAVWGSYVKKEKVISGFRDCVLKNRTLLPTSQSSQLHPWLSGTQRPSGQARQAPSKGDEKLC